MGALFRGFERKAADPLAIWHEMMKQGTASKSGQTINLQTAFRVSVFFACLRVLSQGCAQVPFKLFRETEEGGLTKRNAARDEPLYDVVTVKPNEWTTSFEFRETMVIHAALGRAYAFINRSAIGGRIGELILLDPTKVVCEQQDDWSLVYKVTGKSGEVKTFPAEAIWHVRGPSWNGFEGMDIVNLARDALGLAMATEESHAKLHEKGVRPSGTYSVDAILNREQYRALRDWVISENAGANAGAPMILDRSAKWLQTSMTGLDAQHLETREHQLREICRFAMVNPIMVYANDKTTTYASAEQMFLSHVVHTMSPWYARIEQSADCHLLTQQERKSGLYFKFLAAGLLRGAAKERAEYFSKALGAGGSPAWMTQDEVRALEEMNPFGGDAGSLPVATNVPQPPIQ